MPLSETLLNQSCSLRGSLTGAPASKGKTGLWETAQNGTLFLDEVGELPPCFPGKAAARHSGKEITRVGGTVPVVDVYALSPPPTVIFEDMVHQHLFREDLYYRSMYSPC